ncbi:MAG: hypothetical protein C5B49_11125, partial [Bdellovibrio sp.]
MFRRWVSISGKKSILLLGPRRAGKSTLIKQLFPSYRYVNLDDLDELEQSRRDPKGWLLELGKSVVIDEAQRAPEIAIPLKKVIDDEGAHYVLSGSTGLGLFQKTTETLAGRVEIQQLPPCCFGEDKGEPLHSLDRSMVNTKRHREAQRELKDFCQFGGFPEVLTQDSPHE